MSLSQRVHYQIFYYNNWISDNQTGVYTTRTGFLFLRAKNALTSSMKMLWSTTVSVELVYPLSDKTIMLNLLTLGRGLLYSNLICCLFIPKHTHDVIITNHRMIHVCMLACRWDRQWGARKCWSACSYCCLLLHCYDCMLHYVSSATS